MLVQPLQSINTFKLMAGRRSGGESSLSLCVILDVQHIKMDKHSGSMPLSKFISEYKDHLPQAIEVIVGKEDTVQGGISSGEACSLTFMMHSIDVPANHQF